LIYWAIFYQMLIFETESRHNETAYGRQQINGRDGTS
jgi:hypothetical protein